ncbi:hypothetical protein [Sporocytophaga myxococcoides]|uniref:hypothetical protein n=1 Tax=Sporocytophaga myxococcoides TaxID=153721 RepID=UPI00040B6013|nr:hypothetical protein [Sporocytophaga myxococcoides]
MNSRNSNTDYDVDSIIEESLSSLRLLQQRLIVGIDKVKTAIGAIEGLKASSYKEEASEEPSATVTLSKVDIDRLNQASWKELILWGLSQLNNKATMGEITEMISRQPLQQLRNKGENYRLYPTLKVHADAMVKNQVLEKIENKNRKGGVIYQVK